MANTAESQHFAVELVAIAEDVPITTEEMFGDGETIRSTLLFFHVENTSDEPVEWWYDENHFIGSDGFQYEHGETIYDGMGESHDALPPHWYPNPTIHPGRKTRCVAEITEFPNAVSVAEVIYDYGDDHYEIPVNHAELDEPPVTD